MHPAGRIICVFEFKLKELFAASFAAAPSAATSVACSRSDSLSETGVSREVPPSLSQTLATAAKSDPDALLKQLDSHPHGLSEPRLARRARVSA